MVTQSETRFRVRYSDTDSMGIAHHSAHVIWLENGRTDFCRELGFSYADMEKDGVALAVVDLHCRYRAPAHFEDELVVRTSLRDLHEKRLVFAYRVERPKDNVLIAEGETVHISVNREGKVVRIPQNYFAPLRNAEAGPE